MPDIDPLTLERGETLTVDDTTSQYDGTRGRVLQIYDEKVLLELDVWLSCAKLTREFSLDQLRHE